MATEWILDGHTHLREVDFAGGREHRRQLRGSFHGRRRPAVRKRHHMQVRKRALGAILK
jgi:hypothetical protein